MKISEVYGIDLKSFSSSGKSMFISFKKNTGLDYVEFSASIKYKEIMSYCQTWLNINKTILMSPNHPNNTNCSWLISTAYGSYIILNFTFVEV